MKELLTLPEVAKLLGFKERTIYLWSQEGKLPAFKLGTTWRYRSDEIDAWLESHRSPEFQKLEEKRKRLLMRSEYLEFPLSDTPLEKSSNWNVPGQESPLPATVRLSPLSLAPLRALINSLRNLGTRLKSAVVNHNAEMNGEPAAKKTEPSSSFRLIDGRPGSGATVNKLDVPLNLAARFKYEATEFLAGLEENPKDRPNKAPYRSRFAEFQSDRSRILEVLSDGNGRGLFEIAKAIWEIDSDSDPEYGLIRKSLASTLSREVNSKPQNLFRWGRGRFSTRRYEKPVWAIKRAINYDLIDLTRVVVDMKALYKGIQESPGEHFSSVIFSPDNQLADALFKFQAFGMQGPDPSGRKVSKKLLDRTAFDYFNSHVDVDLLAVPVLAVESQLIRRRGKELIFHEEDLASVSEALIEHDPTPESETRLSISSTGSKSWSARTVGKTRFLYDPNSEVIEFLNAHESLRKEITAVIAFRALMYIFGADVDRRNEIGNTPLHLAARAGSLEVARLVIDKLDKRGGR